MAHKVNITLSITEELHKRMKEHPDIKWSEAAREGIRNKLFDVGGVISGKELLKRLPEETRKGIEEISKLPIEDWKRYYKKMKESEKRRARLLTQALSLKKNTA